MVFQIVFAQNLLYLLVSLNYTFLGKGWVYYFNTNKAPLAIRVFALALNLL